MGVGGRVLGGRGGKTDQLVGGVVEVGTHLALIKVARHVAKLYTNLGAFGVQRLASLQQERDPVPACVVNEHRHRTEGGAQAADRTEPGSILYLR